jgi:uncharacterized protein (DUF2147 family)
MRIDRLSLSTAAFAAVVLSAASARADSSALGVWIDHTGRGAVEITDCGGKLCGHVAWVKDAENSSECGKKIIGNVKSVGKNKWDNGWIFDPDRGSKYDVELTLQGDDKLKVMGYAGSKWFSESYTWKRAPADLQKCNGDSAAKSAPAPVETTAKAESKTTSEPAKADTKSDDSIELKAAKTENDDFDSAKPDDANKSDKPAAKETAKAEPAKPEAKESDEAANADPDDEAENAPKAKGPGKVIARLMDELGDGDGPIKVKRNGKTCKITAPYVGVISIPCDGKD